MYFDLVLVLERCGMVWDWYFFKYDILMVFNLGMEVGNKCFNLWYCGGYGWLESGWLFVICGFLFCIIMD